MRRIAAVSVLAAIVGLGLATPASATCMETFHNERLGISSGSCAAPGGPVTGYTCWRDHCVYH